MYFSFRKAKKPQRPVAPSVERKSSGVLVEPLEDRRLLSAAHHVAHAHATHIKHTAHAKTAAAVTAALTAAKSTSAGSSANSTIATAAASATTASSTDSSGSSSTQEIEGQLLSSIQFSQAPAAVRNGLTTLASTDSVAAPTSTSTVYLGNRNGVETYSLVITSSGTTTRLTVDQTGAAVTDPVKSTTTWGTLSGTGTGSNSAAAIEISAIITALGLTPPTSTTTVDVLTASDGTATYSIRLASTSSSSSSSTATTDWQAYDESTVTVGSHGNPVGHQELPFSVLPGAMQTGINSHLPTGATPLAAASTQIVDVLTANGKTFYTTRLTTSGTTTDVTVDSTGAVATLPTSTTAQFSTIPATVQTALQTLATANGVAGTIAATQVVTLYNVGNGTTIYSVSLTATNSTTSNTFTLTISVDQNGNPTVPPQQGHGGCGGGDGGNDDGSGDSVDSLGGFGRHRGRAFA